jgi:hypothetical protein
LELRGANLFELFAISDHPLLRREIALVTSQGAAALFEIKAGEAGAPAATFEMLILPLTHTRDRVDRLLGSIAPVDKPDWLGTVPLATRKVLRSEIIRPDGQPKSIVERQAPFSPVVREARIVRSDRRQFRVYDGGLSRNDGS